MTDYIEETNNDNDVENADYVYGLFKNWYKEAYSVKVPPKKDFTKYMDSKKLTVHKNLIHGIKMSSNDES
jgi:hypothetical protein